MSVAIEIRDEHETDRGWSYAVDLAARRNGRAGPDEEPAGGGDVRRVRVSLAFVDHDHLSGGRVPPSRVVRAVLEALLEVRPAAQWPSMFDVSTVRRMVPDLGERLSGKM